MPRQKFSISCFGSTGRAAAAAAVGRESGVLIPLGPRCDKRSL